MTPEMTIQEASVKRLNALGPRVRAVSINIETKRLCDTDPQHGKGTCWVLSINEQDAHILCLACAVGLAEVQLTDPDQRVTVTVAR